MSNVPTISQLEERIALIRRNIAELVEQAAAHSGAGDDARTADRIAQKEEELANLIALRDARRGQALIWHGRVCLKHTSPSGRIHGFARCR